MGPRGALGLALCAIPVAVIAVLGWQQRWVSDDGWINLRVLDQFFAGNGLVFNVGERVELTTSTLWLWLLIVGHALTPWWESGELAVGLGLLLTCLGVVTALDGARRLSGLARSRTGSTMVPFAALAFVALPPVWDFATSGLETGRVFARLGSCGWLLARRLERTASRRVAPAAVAPLTAVVIGLGPLIRPDLALVAGCFGLGLLVLQGRPTARGWLPTIAWAAALPLAWQVFRAGYYAALVPNTALAKSAGSSDLARGLGYLADYAGRYALVVPIALAALATVVVVRRSIPRVRRGLVVVVLASVGGGALHAAYVIWIGGDFMHARMLLPATFAVLAPVFAVRLPTRPGSGWAVLCLGVLVVWSSVVATSVRTPYDDRYDPETGISNERGFWTRGGELPLVTRADIRNTPNGRFATALRNDLDSGVTYFAGGGERYPVAPGYGVVIAHGNLGILGVVGGNDLVIADTWGLADPVSARFTWSDADATERAGHRLRPLSWRQARYAAPTPADSPEITLARATLACGEVATLLDAVNAPMTPGLFVDNLTRSVSFTALEIPADAAQAHAQFCG